MTPPTAEPLPSAARFLEGLAAGIQRCHVANGLALVAISGGPDSVALLRGLQALRQQFNLHLSAAHVDHGLRPESAAEARWVASLCHQQGIPCLHFVEDVRARARDSRCSLETAARHGRYACLVRAAREHQCPYVVTAHTSDDQAETVLHHIVRGTGLAGLRGMRPVRPLGAGVHLARPLLGVWRRDVLAWLAAIGQDYCTDPSNVDPRHTRNRLRQMALPALEAATGRDVRQALVRLADQAAAWETCWQPVVDAWLARVLRDGTATCCRVECTALAEQPREFVRQVLRGVWARRGWPQGELRASHWRQLAQLVVCGGARLTLPGAVSALRRGTLLVLERGSGEEVA